jgi:cytochrome b
MSASYESIDVAVTPKQRQVWDLPLRVFHWTLVIAFIGAYVTNRLGVNYFKYHLWCGYTVIVLVAFRILWGIVGTHHARFTNFVRGPLTSLRYAWQILRGTEQSHAGHNPMGAWMVLLLLLTLFVQAFTGLFGDDQIMNLGPLYGYVNAETSSILTSLHRQLFYWIAGAAAVHILAVAAHVFFKEENLVSAMITGRKPAHAVAEAESIRNSRIWLAVLLLSVLVSALTWLVVSAPPVVDFSLE